MTQGEELYIKGALEEAYPVLLDEAKAMDGRAMYLLAQYSLQGLASVKANPLDAALWFSKGKNASPLCVIGSAFFEREPDREALLRAFQEVQEAAEAGDVLSLFCASYALRGVASIIAPDQKKRLAFLAKAADASFWQAENDLGLIYLNGRETAQDKERGFTLLAKAARAGAGISEYHLAFCLLHGEGTKPNPPKAIAFYQRAWKHGYGKAAVELGMQYESGANVKADPKKAFLLYKKAAEAGFAEAKAHLGDCYYDGKGTEADRKKAEVLYEKAAKMGDGYGMLRMGQIEMGRDEMEKAFTYFYQSSRLGIPVAQYLTGICFLRGLGVAANRDLGIRCLQEAARNGSREAMEALAQAGL